MPQLCSEFRFGSAPAGSRDKSRLTPLQLARCAAPHDTASRVRPVLAHIRAAVPCAALGSRRGPPKKRTLHELARKHANHHSGSTDHVGAAQCLTGAVCRSTRPRSPRASLLKVDCPPLPPAQTVGARVRAFARARLLASCRAVCIRIPRERRWECPPPVASTECVPRRPNARGTRAPSETCSSTKGGKAPTCIH